jgi:hypothetical protein
MIRGKKKVPAYGAISYLRLKVRNGYALTPLEKLVAATAPTNTTKFRG